MASTALSAGGIALQHAPDTDLALKNAKQNAQLQAMQIDLPQDVLDQLLETASNGKLPQLYFGRTPHLKYGDKTHLLQTSPEGYRHEIYLPSGSDDDDYEDGEVDDDLEFAGLVSHSLAVQKAEEATAGVDSALEQLRSSMAAISEFKEANKTIVAEAAPSRNSGHRRFPSKGFKPQHLGPSSHGSPRLSAPSSPMVKPPTSQPSGSHDLLLKALRVPLIHLLAIQPASDSYLAQTCRTSLANVKDLLPKIAKQTDGDKWQLTDKSFKEINPYKFPYKNEEDRERAINSAIKSFDRLRLPKDDKLWQILLPVEERGQGKCLSRLNVKAPEAKPATPLHKMPKLNDKKAAAAKKAEDRDSEKEVKKVKEVKGVQEAAQSKEKKAVKAKAPARKVKETPRPNITSQTAASPRLAANPATASTSAPTSTAPSSNKPSAPSHRHTPSADAMLHIKPIDPSKIRTKKITVPKKAAAPQSNSKPAPSRNVSQRDRTARPVIPVNTKPKNPSPLSASPPVNASDFEDSHPVHKALSGGPSPAKTSSTSSDRSLKRKADNGTQDSKLAVKQPRLDKSTPTHNGIATNGRVYGSTPASANSLKRKSDDSSTSNTPTNKVRKVANIDTAVAKSRYANNTNNDEQPSPADSSSSGTSPGLRLSFRQTVELSQKFKTYYAKYEELYWQLAGADTPPTDAQRSELMRMHKKLEEMKREIKAGVGARA